MGTYPLDIPTPLDILNHPRHTHPLPRHIHPPGPTPLPWKEPGTRDTLPLERTWDQRYPGGKYFITMSLTRILGYTTKRLAVLSEVVRRDRIKCSDQQIQGVGLAMKYRLHNSTSYFSPNSCPGGCTLDILLCLTSVQMHSRVSTPSIYYCALLQSRYIARLVRPGYIIVPYFSPDTYQG